MSGLFKDETRKRTMFIAFRSKSYRYAYKIEGVEQPDQVTKKKSEEAGNDEGDFGDDKELGVVELIRRAGLAARSVIDAIHIRMLPPTPPPPTSRLHYFSDIISA